MRSLTSRGIRPCLQNSKTSSLTPAIRRTTFPPIQKPFSHGDAFLILLPGVLATALVVDITGKDRRRAEWDRQIAIAQEEADRLKERQLEAWSRIQRRSVSQGAWQQRRSLYTASRDVQSIDESNDQFVDEEQEQEMDPLDKETEINTADAQADPLVDQTTEEHQNKHQRFGRLLATRLALQLMLQLRSGRSARYRPSVTVDSNNTTFKQSLDYIVQELDKVLDLMHSIKIHDVPWDIKMPPAYYEKQAEMAKRIADISERYKETEIHLPDYIILFVQLVTEFKIAPSLRSYVLMMRTLGYHQQESPMANYVENAIFDCHEYLDSYTISNVIYRYGKNLDSVRINDFLERMTRSDHHPRPRSVWYRTHVNDIDITIPKSKDGHLMTGLIRTALTNRQQTVAEAYATVFIDRDRIEKYSGIQKWFVIGNFLTGHGKWGSWKTGRRWLETAVLWASDLAQAKNHVLGRVILRMLDFCVSCGQKEDYEMILKAAIAARIPIPPIDSTRLIRVSGRMSQIRLDWIKRTRHAIGHENSLDQVITENQIGIFQSALKGRYDGKQESHPKPFHPSDSNWTDKSTVGWNPLLAARRLEETSQQRQSTVNTGFKNFPSSRTRSSFPPQGPQNSLSQEPFDTESSSIADTSHFASPFFRSMHDLSVSTPNLTDDQFGNSPNLELEQLRTDLAAANHQLQEMEKQESKQITRLKRDLEKARAKLKEVETSTRLYESEDWIKQSATGSGY